jgi:hypothetical protein
MAEEYDFDPWSTSSGLPAFMQVRIDNPHFGYDAKVQDGQVCLFIPEGTTLSGDGIDEPEPFNQFYGCGPGWEPADKNGTKVRREDGKMRPFNDNTAYAHLFTSLIAKANEQDMVEDIKQRGTPFEAGLWANLTLDLKRVELEPFTGRDGKEVKRNLLVVNKIVKMGGRGDGEQVQQSASVSSDASETPTPAAALNGAGNGLTPQIKARIKVLARTCKEQGVQQAQFVERAFELEGVLDNPDAEQYVMVGAWEEADA